MMGNVLDLFSRPTAAWFRAAFGTPTKVQEEAWPAIRAEKPVLVSAPTGTGKTLSAFLTFIDRLTVMGQAGKLEEKLYVIYVSPLKSLAGDIRENLRRPLEGIKAMEQELTGMATDITVAIRTGDTLPRDRQRMIKHPPHILIITPESLYLMLTGKNSRQLLRTARAVIIDELHAMIDTKRGAHLMLSLARLDHLCGQPVQRIGLSATIEPLELAADYLAPEPAVIVAPAMDKKIQIEIMGTLPRLGRRKDPVWEELAAVVYRQCQGRKSVIAFCEGRRYAEKIGYYVNQIGGEGFARVHHGSLSKEQRLITEQSLRDGTLRLLCATSSMELGIDVGDIDQVLQIGCPRTVSGTMQRLGRAGHGPGRVSLMYMYPRTAPEGLMCAVTAEVARQGGVEQAAPPRMCLDVLAQHLVSMATEEYTVEEVLAIVTRAYSFCGLTAADIRSVLRMLAGDYEHKREIPVRPRILYDRIHDRVFGDAYSRMLAVAAGGTIPDKGLYLARTEDGVTLGELDEEFVYETRIGDKIVLGSFAWRVLRQDRDTVFVAPASTDGARLPFWKGEIKGRSLRTSLAFGKMFRDFGAGIENGTIMEDLTRLGMNGSAAESAADFLRRQLAATGVLPDDRTIVVEHFTDHANCHQIMVHAPYGKRINAPLSLLLQNSVMTALKVNVGGVDEEDGFLIYPYGEEILPEGLLYRIPPMAARKIVEVMLPLTPIFSMTFRYNAARALMMGMKNQGRQPLWLQRLKSTEMLDNLLNSEPDHPLLRETRRECLEDLWDIDGVITILNGIQSGMIAVREVYTEVPSPMSLPLQWQVEAAEMYSYTPATAGLQKSVYAELDVINQIKPGEEELKQQQERKKIPADSEQLHSLLMIEGDLLAEELAAINGPNGQLFIEALIAQEAVTYIEPGLWIAAEQREEYETALAGERIDSAGTADIASTADIAGTADRAGTVNRISKEGISTNGDQKNSLAHIIRRMLYYRGAMTAEQIGRRYFLSVALVHAVIDELVETGSIVVDEGFYYHAKLYSRARKATVKNLRAQTVTRPGEAYAALMAALVTANAAAEEQLHLTLDKYCGRPFPAGWWETAILARRVKGYRENMLDLLLSKGEFFWRFNQDKNLCFERYEDIDWDQPAREAEADWSEDERLLYRELCKRGASFMSAFKHLSLTGSAQEGLLSLARKGYVYADSFLPVRQLLNWDKIKKAAPRTRVNARVMALSAGRWDIVRPRKEKMEEWLERLFEQQIILCRETYHRPEAYLAEETGWSRALELLRIWEFTGRVRRGYFVAGMSGAQFVRAQDYEGVILALQREAPDIVWLNAVDPAQVWGKALSVKAGKDFMNLPGTLVALCGGIPVAVLERQGKTLRLLGDEMKAEAMINNEMKTGAMINNEMKAEAMINNEMKTEAMIDNEAKTGEMINNKIKTTERIRDDTADDPKPVAIIKELVLLYKQKKVLSDKKRLVIKEYPPLAEAALKEAGFHKEMLDYVLYL